MLATDKIEDVLPPNTPAQRMSGEERRRQLIEVAARLFSRKGFNGTTTKEIAQAAEVSEGNIFRHFAGKDALYAAVFDEKAKEMNIFETLTGLRRPAAAGDDRAVFRELMTLILEHHRRNRDFVRMILFGTLEGNEIARNFVARQLLPVREFLTEYLAERQRAGIFRKRNIPATVRAILAMPSQHAMITELFCVEGYEVPDAEAIESFTQTALDALCVPGRLEDQKTEEEENV